nr:aldo/keto reductase [Asaia platycodi]
MPSIPSRHSRANILWERNVESDILPVLRELGIGFVPFSPLGRGFLTGTAQPAESYPAADFRRTDPRFMGACYDANMKPLPASETWQRATSYASADRSGLAASQGTGYRTDTGHKENAISG